MVGYLTMSKQLAVKIHLKIAIIFGSDTYRVTKKGISTPKSLSPTPETMHAEIP